MTSTCSEVLMQVHYFLAREVIIDEHLYKACKADAAKVCSTPPPPPPHLLSTSPIFPSSPSSSPPSPGQVCHAGPGWRHTETDSKHTLVFPCLVSQLLPLLLLLLSSSSSPPPISSSSSGEESLQ